MSLSSAGLVNAAVAFIAKKSAAIAAASGALLSSIGILLAAHGVMLWEHGNTVTQANQSTQQVLVQKRNRFQHMEAVMNRKARQQHRLGAVCAQSATTCQAPVHAYHTLYKTVRAIRLDLPRWAAENGIDLSMMQNPMRRMRPANRNEGQPVSGYPGISQFGFHLSGTYTDLNHLQHFFHAMPIGGELTGIRIQNNRFTAEITAYGLAS